MNAADDPQTADRPLRENSYEVLQAVAEFFSVLSTPVRLSILHAVCDQERTVSEILSFVGASQSNVSQHLAVLYRADILGRRREGNQIYYFIKSTQALGVCKGVCQQFTQEFEAQKQAGKTG
ncbi:MAG: winged helix-turn-helix transcriptional regulator [Pseudomonadota bacterium]|nr:winged helix-turn-helix transcriptional regulator [Pseudomonadota bacterium]